MTIDREEILQGLLDADDEAFKAGSLTLIDSLIAGMKIWPVQLLFRLRPVWTLKKLRDRIESENIKKESS